MTTKIESNDEAVKASTWDEFIGQETLKRRLYIHIQAALAEERPLEHILLSGPPGSGKSTLAALIAKSTHDNFTPLTMPMKRDALLNAITYPNFPGGILFLDEIHSLSNKEQEVLLPVLSRSAYVDPRTGEDFPIPFLCVIAATTERDKVIAPLHGRFDIRPEFEPYTDTQLGQIVYGMAEMIHLDMNEVTTLALGRAAGGIPRNAKQFVFAARALASTLGHPATAEEILDLCAVATDGLTDLHKRYLDILVAQGGRAGQKTIEGLLQVPGEYLRDMERLLIEKKFLIYTPGGRMLTAQGRARATGVAVKEYSRGTHNLKELENAEDNR